MASSNINKIVQSNINLKPWMLSKNTHEIVNSCIQKIYKQMPTSFRKDMKTVKVATPRPENRGPLSTLKNLERQLPLPTITPRGATIKKSSGAFTGNLAISKRVVKTPNYKIYKSQRYGSSTSSSHSSILKRHEDRKRQRQVQGFGPCNYLMRSFHTSHFEPTYARYLMPARNQNVESNLGSIPDAVKFSSHIVKDLMAVDKFTKNKMSSQKNNLKTVNDYPTNNWQQLYTFNHKAVNAIPKDSAIKYVKLNVERSIRKTKSKLKLSPEHRDYARINVNRVAQLKHPKPPNELFTAQHDRHNTELHEKHRRNRMKKLGLIESSTASENQEMENTSKKSFNDAPTKNNNELAEQHHTTLQPKKNVAVEQAGKTTPTLANQLQNKLAAEYLLNMPLNNSSKTSSFTSHSDLSSDFDCAVNLGAIPKGYNAISPIAAARAQMPNKAKMSSYRYNRSDFFSTKKY